MSSSSSLTVGDAVIKLEKASELLQARGNARLQEEKRIQEAVTLLADATNDNRTQIPRTRKDLFSLFLSKVEEECGPQMAILCIIGLGSTAVASMKEENRLRLPKAIKNKQASLHCAVLLELENRYWRKSQYTYGEDLIVESRDAY